MSITGFINAYQHCHITRSGYVRRTVLHTSGTFLTWGLVSLSQVKYKVAQCTDTVGYEKSPQRLNIKGFFEIFFLHSTFHRLLLGSLYLKKYQKTLILSLFKKPNIAASLNWIFSDFSELCEFKIDLIHATCFCFSNLPMYLFCTYTYF